MNTAYMFIIAVGYKTVSSKFLMSNNVFAVEINYCSEGQMVHPH